MERFLKDAIEIDENARRQVEDAEQKKNNVHNLLKEQKKVINERYTKEAESKASEYEENLKKKSEELKENAEALVSEELTRLQENYDKNHTTWEEKIFKNVIEH